MRQVEYDVMSAIRGKRNAGCNNTTITFNEKATKGYVVLHGNLIATIDYTKRNVKLFDGGFQSNVTEISVIRNTGFLSLLRMEWYSRSN